MPYRFSPIFQGYYPNSSRSPQIHTIISRTKQINTILTSFPIPDSPTVYSRYQNTKFLRAATQIHAHIAISGLPNGAILKDQLFRFYFKNGFFRHAHKLFDEFSEQCVVLWNSLLSEQIKNGLCKEALGGFREMRVLGIECDEFSFPSVFSACGIVKDLKAGMQIHGLVIVRGFNFHIRVLNSLVSMYAKCGVIQNSSRLVFENCLHTDVITWNTLLSCYMRSNLLKEVVGLFQNMVMSGIKPNDLSFPAIMNACAGLRVRDQGRKVHVFVIKLGYNPDLYTRNALVNMYAKVGDICAALTSFEEILDPDIIAYNTMISGHSYNNKDREALHLFIKMRRIGIRFDEVTFSAILKSTTRLLATILIDQIHALFSKSGLPWDKYVSSGFIDSYGKCGKLESAARIFEQNLKVSDLVVFTSIITAYAEQGRVNEALQVFSYSMQCSSADLKPDEFACSAMLNACANSLSFEQGKHTHAIVLKLGFMSDSFVSDSLVNMYAKCGSIHNARCAFHDTSVKSHVSWDMIIGGVSHHGFWEETLKLYDEMVRSGVSPTRITMGNVLCACNHAGMVKEAKAYFFSMKESHGIEPDVEHYGCMIDVLGRAGELDQAMEIVDSMPFKGDALVWGAIMGASLRHKNLGFGKRAAEELFKLEPANLGNYVHLANLYASLGMWGEAEKVRSVMKDVELGLLDDKGGKSWV